MYTTTSRLPKCTSNPIVQRHKASPRPEKAPEWGAGCPLWNLIVLPLCPGACPRHWCFHRLINSWLQSGHPNRSANSGVNF